LLVGIDNTLKFIDFRRKFMVLGDKQHEKQQDVRIKKLENDLDQQKKRINTLEKRANADDVLVMKLEKRIESLEKRKTVKKTKK